MKHIATIITEPIECKTIMNEKTSDDCILLLGSYTKAYWLEEKKAYDKKRYTPEMIRASLAKRAEVFPPIFREADLEKVPRFIQDYVLHEKWKDKGLYIHGPCGTGKTYAVYAIARTFIANDKPVKVVNSAELIQSIKDDFGKKDTGYYEPTVFENLMKYEDALIIDDLGAEKVTDFVAETLYSLINKRYEYRRLTLFSSNFGLQALSERVGDRIASRIVEMCYVAILDGADKRLETAEVLK